MLRCGQNLYTVLSQTRRFKMILVSPGSPVERHARFPVAVCYTWMDRDPVAHMSVFGFLL
jgi:hypothetical protein